MSGPGALLVTGGTGFAMSHLVRRWLERHPQADAFCIDAAAPDEHAERFFAPVADRVHLIQADILEPSLWRSLDAHEDIGFVVHGAAVTSIERLVHTDGPGRPGLGAARRSIDVNIGGALNVLEFAANHPGIQRLVNVSSGSVYGNEGPDPLPENGFVRPHGIYAICKYAAELFSGYAADHLGLAAVSVRLSGVFGPMDRETAARNVRSAPRVIAERGLQGKPVRVRSLGTQGDFVYAGDVASAIISLLEAPSLRYPVYNVAAGELCSFNRLLEHFARAVPDLEYREVGENGEADLDQDPGLCRGRFGAYDISRIRKDTGWAPRPLAETVAEYVDWLRGGSLKA